MSKSHAVPQPPEFARSGWSRLGHIVFGGGLAGFLITYGSVLLAKDVTQAPLLLLCAPVIHLGALLRLPGAAIYAAVLGFVVYALYAAAIFCPGSTRGRWIGLIAVILMHLAFIGTLSLLPLLGVEL
jgi:hypothetical protein